MVVGMKRGCSVAGGVWRGGLSRSGASTLMSVWSPAGVAGLGCVGWSPA